MNVLEIVDSVYTVLQTGTALPIVKNRTADDWTADQYFVINSLSNTPDQVLDVCPINVNCHVKDKSKSIPDVANLKTMANAARSVLNRYFTTQITIDLLNEILIQDKERKEHYINLKFIVRIIK